MVKQSRLEFGQLDKGSCWWLPTNPGQPSTPAAVLCGAAVPGCVLSCIVVPCCAVWPQDYEDVRQLKSLIQRHLKFTGSQVARNTLLNWDKERTKFVKVGRWL